MFEMQILSNFNAQINNLVLFKIKLCLLRFIKGKRSGLGKFLVTEGPFKNDEKCFLFHFKRSFCS